jgi:exonuclease III
VQETKLASISPSDAVDIAGADRQDFYFLPAHGTRGGVAIFWDTSLVSLSNPCIRQFSVTATVQIVSTGTSFLLSSVYGPVDDDLKSIFLAEMEAIKPALDAPWLIAGDFNLIYEARDKNNLNLNRRLMGQFRAALDRSGLREIRCHNRLFSWSNEHDQPTLVRLDRFFCTPSWEALFQACAVQALSTSSSDHCPLLLTDIQSPPRRAVFRFESFWPRFPGFF